MHSEVIITDQELPVKVITAIEKGSKIEAIKLLREATGIGLANAKVLVDRASTRLAAKNPTPVIVEDEGRSAMLPKLLLLVALLFAFYHFFIAT